MSDAEPQETVCHEAVGVFADWPSLQRAVDELLVNGFDRSDVSMLAGEKVVEQKLGRVYEKVSELEDDASVPRAAFVGRDSLTEGKAGAIGVLGYLGAATAVGAVVASGGALAWTIVAAVAAGGGGVALGSLVAKALGRQRAHDLQAQIERGGLLLWVRTGGPESQKKAADILQRFGATDVHIHAFETASLPDRDPLTGFNPDPFLPNARV